MKRELVEHLTGKASDCTIKEACQSPTLVTMDDQRERFYEMIRYLGNRVYNRYLDYGALLLGITWIVKESGTVEFSYNAVKVMQKVYFYLMFDDRHDLYQNLPGELDRLELTNRDMFWRLVSAIVVTCINEEGTGG